MKFTNKLERDRKIALQYSTVSLLSRAYKKCSYKLVAMFNIPVR